MANRFNVRIPPENPGGEAAALHVKEIAQKDFEAETAGPLPVVLDFYGKDSKPCEVLAPRLGAVAEKFAGKVRFLKVLRTENAQLAARLGVTANPTVVFLVEGKEAAERLSGDEIKRTDLKARVEAMLGVPAAAQPVAAIPTP
jgi:thioredoxin-like negative regulator of GroEL